LKIAKMLLIFLIINNIIGCLRVRGLSTSDITERKYNVYEEMDRKNLSCSIQGNLWDLDISHMLYFY